MTNQGETCQLVSVAEAAGILGVSVATIRRRIKAGQLEAETLIRPQGTVFLVRVPVDASAGVSDAYDTDQAPRVTTRTEASPTALMAVWSETFLAPLLAVNERQAQEIGQLREDRGRLTAELERAASTIVALSPVQEARTASEPPAPATDAPSPLPISLSTLVPWLITGAALISTGRAAVDGVSPETLLAGAIIIAVMVAVYVIRKRIGRGKPTGSSGGAARE